MRRQVADHLVAQHEIERRLRAASTASASPITHVAVVAEPLLLRGGERGRELDDRVLDRAAGGAQPRDRIARDVAEPGADLEHAHAARRARASRDTSASISVSPYVRPRERRVRHAQQVRQRGLLVIELRVGVGDVVLVVVGERDRAAAPACRASTAGTASSTRGTAAPCAGPLRVRRPRHHRQLERLDVGVGEPADERDAASSSSCLHAQLDEALLAVERVPHRGLFGIEHDLRDRALAPRGPQRQPIVAALPDVPLALDRHERPQRCRARPRRARRAPRARAARRRTARGSASSKRRANRSIVASVSAPSANASIRSAMSGLISIR